MTISRTRPDSHTAVNSDSDSDDDVRDIRCIRGRSMRSKFCGSPFMLLVVCALPTAVDSTACPLNQQSDVLDKEFDGWFSEEQLAVDCDIASIISYEKTFLACNSFSASKHKMCGLLDTGCTPQSVFTAGIARYLTNKCESTATYRGAFGPSSLQSEVCGNLTMRIINESSGKETGDSYTLRVETISTLNQNLLSYYQMKRDGFDLHFSEDGDFLKHRVNGILIPLCFDIVQCAWFLHFTCDPQTGECMPVTSAFFDDDQDAFDNDAALGDKSGIRGGKAMTKLQFHCMQGHVGHHPDCWICNAIKRTTRKVNREHDRFSENREGSYWSVDLVCFNWPAKDGSLYFACARDRKTRYPDGFTLVDRGEFGDKLTAFADKIRKTFQKYHKNHTVFSKLSLDNAGEQSSENSIFQDKAMNVDGGKVDFEYNDPSRVQGKSINELTVKALSLGCKAIMVCSNLPIEDWPDAMTDTLYLRQRHPIGENIRSDGDAVRPIEEMTDGDHSRKKCNHDLSHYCNTFTVARVSTPNILGSDLKNMVRERYCYCVGRNGNIPIWYCPANKQKYKSKDWIKIELTDGQNYRHFFDLKINCPLSRPDTIPIGLRSKAPLKKFDDVLYDIVNDTVQPNSTDDAARGSASDTLQVFDDLNGIASAPNTIVGKTVLKDFPGHGLCRGHIQSFKSDDNMHTEWPWCVLWDDGNKSGFNLLDVYNYCIAYRDGRDLPPSSSKAAPTATVEADIQVQTTIVNDDDDGVLQSAVARFNSLLLDFQVTKNNDTWTDVCDHFQLNKQYRPAYFQWLQHYHGYGSRKVDGLPHIKIINPYGSSKKTQHFDAGVPFPAPVGGEWDDMCLEASGQVQRVLMEVASRDLFLASILERGSFTSNTENISSQIVREQNETRNRIASLVQRLSTDEDDCEILSESEDPKTKFTQDASLDRTEVSLPISSVNGAEEVIAELCEDGDVLNELVSEMNSEGIAFRAIDSNTVEVIVEVGRSDFPGSKTVANVSAEDLEEEMKNIAEWKGLTAPTSIGDALSRPDANLWKEAIRKEIMVFVKLNVMSNGHTARELEEEGIPPKPIPLRYVFKVKWDPSGGYQKHKARLCLVGHPKYCIEGVHFQKSDVYACCPDSSMIRLIMVVAFLEKWGNTNFDIKSAYLQALAGEGTSIAMSHPKEFKEFNENGEELLSKLLQNLYGHPGAASAWQKTLYAWIKERFSRDGWKVKICHSDRGVLILTSPSGQYSPWTRPSGENQIIMIVHSDDVDVYSEHEEDRLFIAQEFNEKFGVVMGDSRYMLGVLREITELPNGHRMLKLSMPEYISDLVDTYAEFLPKKTPSSPWKPKFFMGIKQQDYNPSIVEQRKYRELGYMRLVGSLLWLARMSYDELAFGVSMLCSVMSKPSELAWNAALDMLKWLGDNKDCGVIYRTDFTGMIVSGTSSVKVTSTDLHCYVDSGHGQFDDGKAQHGHVIVLAGGTVKSVSKKHDVVTAATNYSEYIGQFHASQNVMAARIMLEELGPIGAKYIQTPTYIAGDNSAAIGVARLKKSPGHFQLKYHYQRECVEDGHLLYIQVGTKDNTADLMTKPVETATYNHLAPRLKGMASL